MSARLLDKSTIFVFIVILLSGCASQIAKVREANIENDVKSFYAYQSIDKNRRVFVFVHGIIGNAKTTWKNKQNGTYFYDLLRKDNTGVFSDSDDVFVFGFPSTLFGGDSYTLEEAANSLAEAMRKNNVTEYKEIVFVAHSMGGLVTMRYLLLDPDDVAKKVPLVFFYSTPQVGASIANLGRIFSNNPAFLSLVNGMSQVGINPCLEGIRNEWRSKTRSKKITTKIGCAYEKKPIFSFLFWHTYVVDQMSATCLCDGPAHAIDADHIDMVKPLDIESDSYGALWDEFKLFSPPTRFLSGQGATGNSGTLTAISSNVSLHPINIKILTIDPSVTGSQPTTIKDVSVLFHTNNSEKYYDTWVTTQIVCDGKSIAGRSGPISMFPKESFNGTITLPLLMEPAEIDRFNSKCSFLININPNSRDNLRFNVNLEIKFTDKSTIKYEKSDIALDSVYWHKEYTFQLKD